MTKLKLPTLALIVATTVGLAFANKPTLACENSLQYIYANGKYIEVGIYGQDFDCFVSSGVCTFYKPDPMGHPDVYAPCHEGIYTPL